jgi:hypothetical protein
MRSKVFRSLILAGALVALSVPVLNVTQMGTASAATCPVGVPGPTCTSSGSTAVDTYISPISVTSPILSMFPETPVGPQATADIILGGHLMFTVYDPRGNYQGFTASISSTGYASSLFPLDTQSPSDIIVSGTPGVQTLCRGPMFPCAPGVGTGVGGNLGGSGTVVLAECPTEEISEPIFNVDVPLSVDFPYTPGSGGVAEKFGSYPASWFATYYVTIVDGQDVNSFSQYGCPPFGPP